MRIWPKNYGLIRQHLSLELKGKSVQRGHQIVLSLACGRSQPVRPAPPAPPADVAITFQHRQPIALRVASVDVVDQYVPTLKSPHVEHLHSVTPASVVHTWATERLNTVGARGLVTLIITQASVIEQSLEVDQGLTGLFSDDPDTKLVGLVHARFEHVDVGPPAASRAVEITAEASVEVLESATLNERDMAYFQVVEKLAGELDRVLTAEIENSLGSLIVR